MPAVLAPPSITEEDLAAFHVQAFGNPPPKDSLPRYEAAEQFNQAWDYGTEEDELGYYPDGRKRTLTDQQIAMFRHTEVSMLIRQRELELENAAAGKCNESADKAAVEQRAELRPSPDVGKKALNGTQRKKRKTLGHGKKEQNRGEGMLSRRDIRELDDAQAVDQALDYD